MATNNPVGPDTPISVRIILQDNSSRKLKLPLKDLGPTVLPDKLRHVLSIPAGQDFKVERFSDSAAHYVTLDSENPSVYKTLFRAAKAKLKLRLRVTLPDQPDQAPEASDMADKNTLSSAASSTTRLISNDGVPVSITGRHNYRPDARASIIDAAGDLARMPSFKSYNNSKGLAKAVDGEGEAPVPRPFPARENFFAELANISRERELALRTKDAPVPFPAGAWSVYCNACDKAMIDEHYHCSICDDGDYDLCETCVNAGIHCPGENHWMIKRFVKSGKVISSMTERVAPKPKHLAQKEMPGAYNEEVKPEHQPLVEPEPHVEEEEHPTRTCNSCVKVFPEAAFVTCGECWDYDLCMDCLVVNKHGHHPGHSFKPATSQTVVSPLAEFMCSAGRNLRHAAICDGCDKGIYGVRHKCLNCPDWDYCADCVKNARFIHPHHRFAPIYEPLAEPRTHSVTHHGIYCDGPLCAGKQSQTYIKGIRYKCAVCDDTDFCANCEALPTNRHNRTHPLIKFKTPVRNVSVTTMGEDKNGSAMAPMGDFHARRSTATETTPVAPSVNAATQVQTIADVKPSVGGTHKPMKEKIEIKDLLAEPIQEPTQEKIKVGDLLSSPVPEVKAETPVKSESTPEPPKFVSLKPIIPSDLNAHFIRDTIPDGTKVEPEERFTQVWTLRNPGPYAWPAGCSVRYVGGDNMLNVDNNHPTSAIDLADAAESNVVGRVVEVGEEISFRVLMKAPKREGTSISYWRLKAADGTPFGHRLWCHIDVQKVPPPVVEQADISRVGVDPLNPQGNHALQDHQMQLMLLEQQNKKRLLMARQEQDNLLQQTEAKPEGSTMIFPKLEKESPSASVHESAPSAGSPAPESVKAESEKSELEIFEDAESVEILDADDSSSDDDGFVTDEEYDILDASDEETAARR